jgi:hypothetical protein
MHMCEQLRRKSLRKYVISIFQPTLARELLAEQINVWLAETEPQKLNLSTLLNYME